MNTDNMLQLKISPKKERYYSDETNFGIYICKNITDPENLVITITGNMQKLSIGQEYNITCEEFHHKDYGKQYKVHSIYSESLEGKEEECFLRTMVTQRQADEIMKVYDEPITAIRNDEFDCDKVLGIGHKTYEKIKHKIESNIKMMKALAEFGKYGITYNQIEKMVDKYGNSELMIKKVKENPYLLYRDIKGIGFIKADFIAKSIGYPFDGYDRIQAGIIYTLEQNENFGSTWISKQDAKERAEEILKLTIDDFHNYIKEELLFYSEGNKLSLRETYQCEVDISNELNRIHGYSLPFFKEGEIDELLPKVEEKNNIKYTEKQKEIFYKVSEHAVNVLTGEAGKGKTSTLKGLLDMLDIKNIEYVLISPTAKAAKVIEKLTGRKASTIHRALGLIPELGNSNIKMGEIEKDLVIIDEASMCDIYLFRHIIKTIKKGNKILLVGDPAQLESVATGNILHDIINSKKFATVCLDKVFRQALDSGILKSATNVWQGKSFYSGVNGEILEIGVNKDCKVWFGTKDKTAKRVGIIFKKMIQKYNISDIMVISPMKNGVSGVKALNKMLQEIYNPPSENKYQIQLKRNIFREGDKVIHIKNSYDSIWLDINLDEMDGEYEKGIFNGDTGIIKSINTEEGYVYVDYGDKIIEYNKNTLDMLELAYCTTVHKAQGSASPVVICALDFSHYMMLKRSLLYTAITRASELLFLVVDKRALSVAIKNDTQVDKNTHLCELIKKNVDN